VFARFVARLEEAERDGESIEGTHIGLEGVDPTPALLAWTESTKAEFEEVKRRREAHIQAMYDQLEALWRRLGVPEEAMDEFVDEHRGSTEDTIRAYEGELERMLELKQERMGTFIENARNEIAKLWDDLMVGEEEREDFAPFADGLCSAIVSVNTRLMRVLQMNTRRSFSHYTRMKSCD
jgi:protein regulator of cytokinesis 1